MSDEKDYGEPSGWHSNRGGFEMNGTTSAGIFCALCGARVNEGVNHICLNAPTPPTKTATAYRSPSQQEIDGPLFNAVWNAIKKWDIKRENESSYAGANGNDVCHIIDAIALLNQPKNLTAEQFQELAQHEWFMRSKTMPKIAPEVFEAIYQALPPHIASAQAAQDHEAIRISVANYVQSEGCGCCQGHNHSEHKKALAELLKVPMYSDGSGYDFNAILAANEQDGK